jgi:hypothetical protein
MSGVPGRRKQQQDSFASLRKDNKKATPTTDNEPPSGMTARKATAAAIEESRT